MGKAHRASRRQPWATFWKVVFLQRSHSSFFRYLALGGAFLCHNGALGRLESSAEVPGVLCCSYRDIVSASDHWRSCHLSNILDDLMSKKFTHSSDHLRVLVPRSALQ